MVAQKIKILLDKEKQTDRRFALVTFSDAKQDFTVPIRKQKSMETGLCNI